MNTKRSVHCTLSGVSGAGKTHLARLLTAAAEADDWVVVDASDRTLTQTAIAGIKAKNDKVLFIDAEGEV